MIPLRLEMALRNMQAADPASAPDVVATLAAEIGATDVVLYLVDFGQTSLRPVTGGGASGESPTEEAVAASMAGRAFVDQSPATTDRPGGARVWVPVIEGSDRTGVLAMTVRTADAETITACEELGLLAGYLVASHGRVTDRYSVSRRRRSMSLAATMQWELLPPLVFRTGQLSVGGLVEPAYDVGGDIFDYALNGTTFDVAIFDGMGHGVESALIAALTVGSYRHDRREGLALDVIHRNLDAALTEHGRDFVFATGQLVRIDLDTGAMTWTNAGHPLPLLVRGGRVVGELECDATPPWGLGSVVPAKREPVVATEALQPGDSVLFYTDGVIEAHAAGGEQFGVERLMDLVGQHASDELQPEEIVRRLVRSVRDHQDTELADDATVVLVKWTGP